MYKYKVESYQSTDDTGSSASVSVVLYKVVIFIYGMIFIQHGLAGKEFLQNNGTESVKHEISSIKKA